jgi:lysophospholipase L1-like esterase
MAEQRDDNLMNRFDEAGLRRFRARDGVAAILLAALLLILFQGPSVLKAGNEMTPGVGRELVLAVGRPSNWLARRLPLLTLASEGTRWLNPEPNLSGPGGFKSAGSLALGQVPPVTPTAFDPRELGEAAPPRKPLHTLLVTGDSMSMPLDSDLAESLIPQGVHVVQEPHIGTGISTTFIVDWGTLSAEQVKRFHPDAVVIFIGANDGFPMTGPEGREVSCCTSSWAAIYANRVRQIMNTYRQDGAAHVYWITLPAPRDQERARIARVVNAAIEVAAQPWASQIQIIDSVPIFTPGFVYRDAMNVDGKQTIVRESDGVHLNEAGSSLLARVVLEQLSQHFSY